MTRRGLSRNLNSDHELTSCILRTPILSLNLKTRLQFTQDHARKTRNVSPTQATPFDGSFVHITSPNEAMFPSPSPAAIPTCHPPLRDSELGGAPDAQEAARALRRFVCYTLTFLLRLEMSTLCSSLDMVRHAPFADVAFTECRQKRLRHPLPLQLRI